MTKTIDSLIEQAAKEFWTLETQVEKAEFLEKKIREGYEFGYKEADDMYPQPMSNKVTTFLVNENMIVWAFRYALGRRTGAVIDVVEFLIANWPQLLKFTQDQIRREIETAKQQGLVGDREQWQEILDMKNETRT